MIDREVERLRGLRATALRTRAVARALGEATSAREDGAPVGDGWLDRGRCAAWRVARTVSGHLRGHPYASFQKDAGLGVVLANSLTAAGAAWSVKTPRQVLLRFDAELRALFRQLCDVRALTRVADLDESLGRSQIELRALLAALAHETGTSNVPAKANLPGPAVRGAALESNWPYLAL